MAEKVEILNIETKTLKELRSELKELKKQLEEMVIGSEDYNSTLKEITERQQELSTITKSSVSDMEGSYNALTKQLAELRKAWRETGDEAERDAIGQQISELNGQLKDLDASIGNFQRNVGNYESALTGLTQRFDDAAEEAEHMHENFEHGVRVAAALVGGFEVVTASLELMGVESEEATKAMKKMQSVMAIVQGLEAMADGATSFIHLSKAIKKAQAAWMALDAATKRTWIGMALAALAAVIATVILNWEKISSLWSDTKPQTDAAYAMQHLNNQLKDHNIELLKMQNLNASEYLEKLKLYLGNATLVDAAQIERQRKDIVAEIVKLEKDLESHNKTITASAESSSQQLVDKYTKINNLLSKNIRELTHKERKYLDEVADIKMFDEFEVDNKFLKHFTNIEEFANIVNGNYLKNITSGDKELWEEYAQKLVDFRTKLADQISNDPLATAIKEDEDIRTALEREILDKKIELVELDNGILIKQQNELDAANEKYKEYSENIKNAKKELDLLLVGDDQLKQFEFEYNEDVAKWEESLNKKYITEEEYHKAIHQVRVNWLSKIEEYQHQLDVQEQEWDKQKTEESIQNLLKVYTTRSMLIDSQFAYNQTLRSIRGDEAAMHESEIENLQTQLDLLTELADNLQQYGDAAKEYIDQINSDIAAIHTRMAEVEASENERRLGKVLELGDILVATAEEIGSAWSRVFSSINKGIEEVGDSINKGEKGWTKYGKIASAGIGVASSMLGTLADMQDTQTEEGFEKNKKLQIAQATMAMLAGIVNTWQSVMSKENSWMTIWGQVAAGTSISAMMLATGLAQINQIKSTSFEGGGSGAASVSPNVTALSAIQNPVQAVNEIQGASTEGEVKDQRVYVLEYDIASTNKKVNVAQSEATF